MTENTASEHENFLARVRAWFEADVEPRLDKVLAFAQANGQHLSEAVGVLADFAEAVAPGDAPEVQAAAGKLKDIAAAAAADLEKFLHE